MVKNILIIYLNINYMKDNNYFEQKYFVPIKEFLMYVSLKKKKRRRKYIMGD